MPKFIATVELCYDGDIPLQDVQELLAGAIEHCRQENMLSRGADDEVSCDWIDVTHTEVSP